MSMKSLSPFCSFWLFVILSWQCEAQTYDTNNEVVETFAGSGFSGYIDGLGQLTMFNNPAAVAADSSGNLFVGDTGNFRIREITPSASVTPFAGDGHNNGFFL